MPQRVRGHGLPPLKATDILLADLGSSLRRSRRNRHHGPRSADEMSAA